MQQSDLDFINSLRQSSRYIEQHRGKTCVIYLPGELLLTESSRKQLSQDVGLLHNLGLKIVLVMGATEQIDQAFETANIKWQSHQQFRITTTEMLPIFQQTIGTVRSQLEASFSQANCMQPSPLTITSGNWVIAQPKGVIDGVDFQHTGNLRKINHQAISANLEAGQIALLTPLAYSLTGELFNLNTLEQACEVASAIQADKLMIFTTEAEIQDLPKQLSIPELDAALKQSSSSEQVRLLTQIRKTSQNVKRIHLMDKHDPSTILIELFTRDGSGTLIFSDRYHQVRQANIDDVGGILDLIAPLEQQGVLVKRSRELLELEIDNFMVIERDQLIIGCAALYQHEEEYAELACLAVNPHYQGQELGSELLNAIEAKAKSISVKSLFLLTTHTHHWFIEHGFEIGKVEDLPEKKQTLYNFQRNSKVLVKQLS
ncbi:amino-acid N-acetyltransferase [Thiomicrorhabdus sp. ZW0627]|uniref:amino-acid N-acetyltransferase n=1 Tax=Thiomicrorhabdus sp. ZW0627 TaxID=3039774 RepID=UPI0024373088|nr:amino-acid N-acetyltransferase [Thiomicrorhabdus sp. ZW0627]MDG6774055.1 amino-acid N-acetyltransferase [Thiomicrorhabdus sp. ZW0627]